MEIIKQTIDKQSVELIRKEDFDGFVKETDLQIEDAVKQRDKAIKELEKAAQLLEDTANKIRSILIEV